MDLLRGSGEVDEVSEGLSGSVFSEARVWAYILRKGDWM